MKKNTLFFVSLFFFSLLTAQNSDYYWKGLFDKPYEFVAITDTFETYIKDTYPDSIPQNKLKNIKDFYRYVYFWKSRLGIINDSLSYLPYAQAAWNNSLTPYCDEPDPAQWELLGPKNYDYQCLGLVAQVLHDPENPDNYLLSSDHGGIWKNQSSGNSWVNVTDELRLPGLSATEIIRNPFNDQHIIASTGSGMSGNGYGMGIIESFDNGSSWHIMEGFPYQTAPKVVKVIYDPNDDDPNDGLTLYAITIKKVYKSTDTGLNWTLFNTTGLSVPQHNIFCDIEIAGNGDIFLTTLSRYDNVNGQIFKYSNDWVNITADYFDPFQKAVISKPYNGKIFILCDGEDRRIYKSTDDGATWENIITNNFTGFAGIYYSPESQIVYFTHLNLYYFKDEEPYNIIGTPYGIPTGHWDIRDIDIMGIEDGNENLLIANDGGISKLKINISNLNNLPYENLNGNYLPIGNFLGLGVDNSSSEFIVAGAVHNHSFRYENDNWIWFGGGDGGDSEVNWDNPDIYYYQNNMIMLSNGGNIIYGNVFSMDWFIGMEYELNPTNPYLAYFGRGKTENSNAKLVIYNEKTKILVIKYAPVDISKVGAIGINTNNHIYISEYSAGSNDGLLPNRFCKSVDVGDTWEDLSANKVYYNNGTEEKSINEVLIWKTIEDIIFNPADPDEIWISIGGVKTSNGIPDPGKFRVLHSTDCGDTWYDYSEGLPAFPVMALEYHLGSDNRIFAGTDCGVFYREHSMTQWECFSEGLPVSIVTDLDYEPNSNYLYSSTYSRAIHKTPVPFNDYNALILPAGENITWDDNKIFYYDLIIPDNTTLTIISDIYFAEGKKIVVKRGGKLILDGGTLTNIRGNNWLGIELHGNSNDPQNSGNQGMVQIINEGTIKNAICGIKTYKPVPIDNSHGPYEYTGGIIIANEAKFINNITAVNILPYNYQSMNSFTKCTFEVNNNDIYTGFMPDCFVKLSCIEGVDIKGCTFIDDHSTLNPEDRMIGINAINSHFLVNHICISGTAPCTLYQPTSFENLKYGIKAIASVSGKPVTIKNSIFKDNHTGIYLCEISNATVNLNTFQRTPNPFFLNFTGLYLNECTGYQVEENDFIGNSDYTGKNYIGLVVNNSGEENNEIYNNYFENLNYGIIAQGINRGDNTGLQLRCNDFSYCESDVSVTPEGSPGVGASQGSPGSNPENMVGNLFYYNGIPNDFDDINNEAEHITYYYPENAPGYNVEPIDYTNNVHPIHITVYPDWTFENGCPSHLNQGGGIEDLKSEMTVAEQKIDSTGNILSLLIDGGDTEQLQTDVNYSVPPETMEIYNELMNESPYLSDTVVSTAIEKENVLPNAMIRDIMVANPNTAKSDELMNKLDERYNPLPDYMKAQILQGRSILSIREETESHLSSFKMQKSRAINNLARCYRNDTVNPQSSSDSLLVLYQNENSLWAKYALAFEYLVRDDSTSAITILDSIPSNFELTPAQNTEHQNYRNYFEIILGLMVENKTFYEADSSDIAELYSIMNNSSANVHALARNLLIAIDTLTYQEPYILPDLLKSSEAYDEYWKLLNTDMPKYLKIHPNPAHDYIIIDYSLEYYKKSLIEITDINGISIKTIEVKNETNQLVIDTRKWNSGIYIATLKNNDKIIENTKFMIVK